MAYKIDLHCHSWFSADGMSTPEELVAAARARGLDGFAITDHNTCAGYHAMVEQGMARADGQPVDGLLIIPGIEVSTAEGHLLCLGVLLPDGLKGTPAAEVCRMVHALGGLAIPAHPYDRFRAGIREQVLDRLEIDGLEVCNAASTLVRYNRRALDYARARGLAMTAGSDAHHHVVLGTAYTLVPAAEFSVRGILDQIPRGTLVHEGAISFRDAFFKTWSNVMRHRRIRPHVPVRA